MKFLIKLLIKKVMEVHLIKSFIKSKIALKESWIK